MSQSFPDGRVEIAARPLGFELSSMTTVSRLSLSLSLSLSRRAAFWEAASAGVFGLLAAG